MLDSESFFNFLSFFNTKIPSPEQCIKLMSEPSQYFSKTKKPVTYSDGALKFLRYKALFLMPLIKMTVSIF